MAVAGNEKGGIHEPVRSVQLAHGLRELGAKGHLDALHGIHHCQPQLAVEHVKVKDVLETHAVEKTMGTIVVVIHLIRQRITRQPVVADKAQVVPGEPLVDNRQPATA